jgi:hypothetical protein
MASTLKHLRSSTADKRPTASGLVDGQLAINTASGTPAVFFKDSNGGVVKVGPAHVGASAPNAVPAGSAGNSLGELWVDNGLTTPGLNYYTGSAFVNLTPSGTATTVGLVELATPAETQTGTDAARAVTPSGLQSKVSDSTSTTSSTTIASSTAVKSAYDLANAALPKAGGTVTGELLIGNTGSLVFEGSSDDSFETTIAVTNPTADHIITFPNVTGTVVTTGDSGTVTSTMIANDTIVNADINSAAAIAYSKLALSSGIVNTDISASAAIAHSKLAALTSANILLGNASNVATSTAVTGDVTISNAGVTAIAAGAIVDADISASAEIAVSKLADGAARQLLQTDAAGTGVEWASNIDIPGTLDVTSAATFDSSVAVTGALTKSGNNVVTVGDTGTVTSTMILDGTILNADVNASAAIAGTKVSPDFGSQNVTTTGTVTGASLSPTSSSVPTNGVYLPAANSVAVATNGTGRLFVNSSGSVGIGTSSPSQTLDVNGVVNFKPAAGYNALFQQSSTSLRINYLNDAASANVSAAYRATSFEWQKGDGGPVVNIDSSGRVGIGTTSVLSLLHLSASALADFRFTDTGEATDQKNWAFQTGTGIGAGTFRLRAINDANNTGENAYLITKSGTSIQTHQWLTGGSERARIDSSGRLLVGTSSTANNIRFLVQGSPSYSGGVVQIANSGSSPSNGDDIGVIQFSDSNHTTSARILVQRDGGTWTSNTSMPTRLVFSTTADGASSPTERMRITNAGYLWINRTTAPATTNTLLAVAGGSTNLCAIFDRTVNDDTIRFTRSETLVGSISVTTTATAYNTSSDYRLKENVAAVTDGITRLQQLKPSRFNFIADPDRTVDGFIAHEAQEVVPECVTGTKDAVDDKGNPVYQGIDQSKLVPLLTAALQEAIDRIEQLEAAVATLQGS